MRSWPAWMPRPLQDSYSLQPDDLRVSGKGERAGTHVGSGCRSDACTVECTVRLSPEEAAWFERWERDQLAQGSRWVLFPLWHSGEIHWEAVRLAERPKLARRLGMHAEYSLKLQVMRRTGMLPDCLLRLFFCWPPCFFFAFDVELRALFRALAPVTVSAVNEALAWEPED